jgi:hypothetical protein
MKDWPDTLAARFEGDVPGFYSPDQPLEEREPFVDEPAVRAIAGAVGAPSTTADYEAIKRQARADVLAELEAERERARQHEAGQAPAKKAGGARKAAPGSRRR